MIASEEFTQWIAKLRDINGKSRILKRIKLAQWNNFGHSKSVNKGIFEMKVAVGPGYRIYYSRKGKTIYWLLNGGDKSTQVRDIERAQVILKRLKEE